MKEAASRTFCNGAFYGGTEVTCVCFYLSRVHDILRTSFKSCARVLSRAHEILKSCARVRTYKPYTMVYKSVARDTNICHCTNAMNRYLLFYN